MPVDKKHILDLKFAEFSAPARNALKKLTATELSMLADEIYRLSHVRNSINNNSPCLHPYKTVTLFTYCTRCGKDWADIDNEV